MTGRPALSDVHVVELQFILVQIRHDKRTETQKEAKYDF